jgi:hypothetical protein
MRVPKTGDGAGPGLWLLEKEESLRSKRRPNGLRDLVLFRDPLVFVPRHRLPFGERAVGTLIERTIQFSRTEGSQRSKFQSKGR